jgi:predicted aspartyl protease
MPPYEAEGFQPPAPVVRAVVRSRNGSVRDVPLLIDTGADASVIPSSVASAAGAETRSAQAAIQAYDGTLVQCEQAELTVEFSRFRFRGPFLVTETDCGILGRNILNNVVLTLDGPALVWSMEAR